jgi:drug/metabolite transporter (DMT)-like permease
MLFASTFTIGKVVLNYLQPIFFIGFRMSVGGILLLGYLYLFKKNKIQLKKQHFWLFAQITIFHIFIAYIAEFWALQYLTSFKAAIIYNLSPFLAAIFAFLFFSEKMTIKKWIGLLVGFFGFFLVLANGKSPGEVKMNAFGFLSWPEIIMLLAVCSSVYGWTIFKKLSNLGYSSIMINGFGMLTGGILALFTSFLFEGPSLLKFSPSSLIFEIWVVLGYSLLLILIANIVCYNLYGHLLKKYSITFLSFAGFFTPLFAALFGTIFLKEIPSIYFFLALMFISSGLYIFYQEELRLGYIKK